MITENFVGYGTVSTDALYQWDVNQVLRIAGSGLTVPPVIHFVNRNPGKTDDALVVQASLSGGVVSAKIHNSLLIEPYDIVAYMYSLADNAGKTLETIRIPVIKRPKPAEFEYTDNITIETAGKLQSEIVAYYNKAISQLTAVDSRLTAAIQSEAEIRAAADKNLQNQIDAIVIGASKDGNAAAEIAQARTDPNGKAYPTLRDRLNAAGIFVGEDGSLYQNE